MQASQLTSGDRQQLEKARSMTTSFWTLLGFRSMGAECVLIGELYISTSVRRRPTSLLRSVRLEASCCHILIPAHHTRISNAQPHFSSHISTTFCHCALTFNMKLTHFGVLAVVATLASGLALPIAKSVDSYSVPKSYEKPSSYTKVTTYSRPASYSNDGEKHYEAPKSYSKTYSAPSEKQDDAPKYESPKSYVSEEKTYEAPSSYEKDEPAKYAEEKRPEHYH